MIDWESSVGVIICAFIAAVVLTVVAAMRGRK
jgi:hypothetical protein